MRPNTNRQRFLKEKEVILRTCIGGDGYPFWRHQTPILNSNILDGLAPFLCKMTIYYNGCCGFIYIKHATVMDTIEDWFENLLYDVTRFGKRWLKVSNTGKVEFMRAVRELKKLQEDLILITGRRARNQ